MPFRNTVLALAFAASLIGPGSAQSAQKPEFAIEIVCYWDDARGEQVCEFRGENVALLSLCTDIEGNKLLSIPPDEIVRLFRDCTSEHPDDPRLSGLIEALIAFLGEEVPGGGRTGRTQQQNEVPEAVHTLVPVLSFTFPGTVQ